MIFLTIHKISYYKVGVSTGSVETRWMGGSFLMVYRNNTGRLGSGLINVCLEASLAVTKERFLCAGTTLYRRKWGSTRDFHRLGTFGAGGVGVGFIIPFRIEHGGD